MSIYSQLNEARQKFHALKLTKTGNNKFAGYMYFELSDFLIPALRVFQEVGLCAIVSFDKEIATMRIADIAQKAGHIDITSPMPSTFDPPKGMQQIQHIGSCETYQRRYLWMAALEIVEHDAIDATTGSDKKIPVGVMGAVLDELAPLTPEDKAYYAELAEIVVSTLLANGPAAANLRIKMEDLDADQRAQLESFLDSKTRSALGKASGKDLPKAKYTF